MKLHVDNARDFQCSLLHKARAAALTHVPLITSWLTHGRLSSGPARDFHAIKIDDCRSQDVQNAATCLEYDLVLQHLQTSSEVICIPGN